MPAESPIIILTGASRGLGLSVLNLLLKDRNARVTTLSRSLTPELEACSKEYSGRVLVLQGDIGKSEDNVEAVKRTVEKWGGLDGLVLNAGAIEPICERSFQPDSASPSYLSNLVRILKSECQHHGNEVVPNEIG